jgi:anaerobic selenocysteine-containing dehydrogenase
MHAPPDSPRRRRTFCRLCEAACGLVATLDSMGQPVLLRPDQQHPVSRGFACAKGTRFREVADHPERLRFPMLRRADGRYERLSWQAAMTWLARRLRPIPGRRAQRPDPGAISPGPAPLWWSAWYPFIQTTAGPLPGTGTPYPGAPPAVLAPDPACGTPAARSLCGNARNAGRGTCVRCHTDVHPDLSPAPPRPQ